MSAPAKTSSQAACDLAAAKGVFDVAGVAASYVNDSILPMVESLKALANFDSEEIGHLRVRLSLIRDLASVGTCLVYDAAGDIEDRRNAAKSKMDELEGGAA